MVLLPIGLLSVSRSLDLGRRRMSIQSVARRRLGIALLPAMGGGRGALFREGPTGVGDEGVASKRGGGGWRRWGPPRSSDQAQTSKHCPFVSCGISSGACGRPRLAVACVAPKAFRHSDIGTQTRMTKNTHPGACFHSMTILSSNFMVRGGCNNSSAGNWAMSPSRKDSFKKQAVRTDNSCCGWGRGWYGEEALGLRKPRSLFWCYAAWAKGAAATMASVD